jgi:hypothetical protein
VIQGGTFAPPLRSVGLHVRLVPGLDGVTDVMIIANPVACKGTPKGRLVSLLLPRLDALGPWVVRAAAGGVTTTFGHQRGTLVRAIPVGSGRWLG